MHIKLIKKIMIHHRVGDMKIELSGCTISANKIKRYIQLALDRCMEEESVPADIVLQEVKERHGSNYCTPGYYLRLYRRRAEMTQVVLAEKLHVKQHHLSEMENNKRPISKKFAKQLAVLLKVDYHKFL